MVQPSGPMFDIGGDAILLAHPKTHIVLDANAAACRLFGYTRAELLRLRTIDLIHSDSIDFIKSLGQLHPRTALHARRKDGSAVAIEASASTLAKDDGAVRCVVAREITDGERDRRLTETHNELRAKQLAALLEVSQALAEKLDLAHLLDVVLDQLANVVEYTEAFIAYQQGDDLCVNNYRGALPREQALGVRIRATDATIFQEVVQSGRPVIVRDIEQQQDRYAALRRRRRILPNRLPLRSVLAVPLVREDQVIGYLRLDHARPGFYTAAHADLALAVANQASIAIENARLFEVGERRRRQLEALYAAEEALYRTLQPGEVLDALVHAATELLGAAKTSVLLWDADKQKLTVHAARGFRPESLRPMSSSLGEGLSTRAANSGEIVDTEDAQTDARITERLRAVNIAEGIRGTVSVPIKVEGDAIGVFNLHYLEKRTFADDERRLLRMFAQRAATAFQNARLYAAERASRERLDVALQVGRMGTCEWTIATDAVSWSPQLEAIHGLQSGTFAGSFEAYLHNVHPDDLDSVRKSIEQALQVGEHHLEYRIVWPDASVHWVESHGRVIRDAQGNVIGMRGVCQDISDRKHAEAERIMLQDRERSALAARAGLEERQHLARELHDSVSQALYGIALGTQTAAAALHDPGDVADADRALEYTHRLAEAALSEMRALILELRPETLEQEGLVAALERHVDSLRARHGLHVRGRLDDEPDLSAEKKHALYRIAQESLHNAVKHARASTLELRLQQSERRLILEVVDDGVGFEPTSSYPGHLGLVSMRERAAAVGASLNIFSAPGAGSRIRVDLPI